MSNAEHLMENAIELIRAGMSLDEFKATNKMWIKDLCQCCEVSPEIVFDMASYVVYSFYE